MSDNAQHGETQPVTQPRYLPQPGYHGRYLRVDLDTGTAAWVSLGVDTLRNFLGGTGLGAFLLLNEEQAGVDPFSSDACLAFVFSPLVGGPLTTSAKFAVVCKSPLTQRYNDAMVSSGFAIAGKAIGADAIVIRGRASSPSLLIIDDGKIEVRSADHLWGTTIPVAEAQIATELPGYKAAVIGPAGEKCVRFATLSHDGRHAGRGGAGAVLGAKQIKGVAVRGTRRTDNAQPSQLRTFAKQLSRKSMGDATAKYRDLGTASNLLAFNRLHALPTKNFQQGSFEGAEKIAPETLVQSRTRTRKSCAACTIGCEHLYELAPADGKGSKSSVRLEYENLFALGSLCGISDPDAVLRASQLCDDMGLDTISTGGTIAFAMECAEEGWLDADWLRFGDGDAMLRAIHAIISGDGIGARLAKGSRHLGNELGPHAAARAPHVKGLELPGYEPRSAQTLALGLAVGARGADHNRSGAYEADFSNRVNRLAADERSIDAAIDTENRAAIIDSLILCKFLRGAFDDLFAAATEMLTMVCGWDVTPTELGVAAERIVATKKLFNIQAGWTPEEDDLPARFTSVALPDAPDASLSLDKLKFLVRGYNEGRNWSSEGWIPESELARLGLQQFATTRNENRTDK